MKILSIETPVPHRFALATRLANALAKRAGQEVVLQINIRKLVKHD